MACPIASLSGFGVEGGSILRDPEIKEGGRKRETARRKKRERERVCVCVKEIHKEGRKKIV